MAKEKTVFFCQNCGFESSKWMGQCPGCRSWNSFVEEKVRKTAAAGRPDGRVRSFSAPVSLAEVDALGETRTKTGIREMDRVLGGGIVGGSLILIGGDPGIGKSTLLLQVCRQLSLDGKRVLYISGEESRHQIKMRADRIGEMPGSLRLFCETSIEVIRETVERDKPEVIVIDSIQTMYADSISSAPGSVSQVREATAALMMIAKGLGITVFIVGHVTKDGSVAGPRVLEHMVDTVLYFEGDRHASYRILRGVKNRFGSTDEIGVFEMRSDGLVEVGNPSEYMLSGRPENVPGSVVSCSVEGTRPVLVEIQALVSKTAFGYPRRTAAGVDVNRVNLLLAVLEKRGGVDLSSYDAYVNIAGGIRMNEPAVDLGIVLALVSCHKNIPVPADCAVFGEVGLSGEIRAVRSADQRVAELKKLGFTKIIMPLANKNKAGKASEDTGTVYVSDIAEAVRALSDKVRP